MNAIILIMKKIVLALLALVLLMGCNKSNEKNHQQDINNEKPIVIDFDIWDVEPIYQFDDIDVNFSLLNHFEDGSFDRHEFYNNNNLYDGFENGGVVVFENNCFGIMNSFGELKTGILFGNIAKLKFKEENPYGEIYLINSGTQLAAEVKSDYSSNFRMAGFGFCGGGFEHASWNENRFGRYMNYHENYDVNGNVIIYKGYEDRDVYKTAVEEGLIKDGDYFVIRSVLDEHNGAISENGFYEGYVLVGKDTQNLLDITLDFLIREFSNDVMFFSKENGNESTYINLDGTIIASGYSDGYGFYEGYAPVCKDNKWGYIDKQGNVVIDFIFDKATPISEGKAWVIYKGRTGRLNILDMLNNNVPFNDETLNIESYTPLPQVQILADNIKIRKAPSTSSEHISNVTKDQVFQYTKKEESDGYTWYEIAKDMWIADKNGEWIKEISK